jgi:hypothetical protein
MPAKLFLIIALSLAMAKCGPPAQSQNSKAAAPEQAQSEQQEAESSEAESDPQSEPVTPQPGTLKYWKIEKADPPITFRQPSGRSVPAKCLDGSPLTVTGSDGNQTNYKCGSGSVGAWTN